MRNTNLQELLQGTKGIAVATAATSFSGIGTDTRKDLTNQVFWALQGESFDAHDFLPKAIAQGAQCLIVHRVPDDLKPHMGKITVIQVGDTLRALQDFANYIRHQWGGKVIGITGSNGKTTSKEFCGQVLGSAFRVHSNKGSFNNHFGLPFNLLSTPNDAQFVLAEMGMNHAGEITRLCEIADPDIVVCTMVGRGHIEHFGSIEKISEAKEEIYKASRPEAVRIYNLDNEFTRRMHERSAQEFPRAQRLTFSEKQKSDVQLELVELHMNSLVVRGRIGEVVEKSVDIPVFGAQNLTNLRVAASVALSCGMEPKKIWESLPLCKTAWGRNQFLSTKKGGQILFDAYNANPDSMKALLQNVPALVCRGRKIGVFAEMLELGPVAPEAHRELGEEVGRSGLDVVYFYGPDAASFEAGIKASGFSKKLFISNAYEETVASEVARMLDKEDLALVKGSRGMKMERFVFLCEPLNFEAK